MLTGEPATEQCLVIDNVNFLNNADIDGTRPAAGGAPNIMIAAGGTQLDKVARGRPHLRVAFPRGLGEPGDTTAITGPQQIRVAPYRYLCDGQLTNCVPQPGTDAAARRAGRQDHGAARLPQVNGRESIVAVHSVNTAAGGGGVRWYELRVDRNRELTLYQQGTYAPDALFRWMASPAIDRHGNIGIGYSFGGRRCFAGQRFAGAAGGRPARAR